MKILFLGFHHRVNDPRLFHRQMRVLKAKRPEVEIYFLSADTLYNVTDYINGKPISEIAPPAAISAASYSVKKTSLYYRIRSYLGRKKRILLLLRPTLKACKLKSDVVQASDARELFWLFLIKCLTGARIIYDAHEDHFNQVYEYFGKTLPALIKACGVSLMEKVFIRFCDAVFCTDEFLYRKYLDKSFNSREVYLLRNFPPITAISKTCDYKEKNELELVYVGGVNAFRGVKETAYYVAEFNRRHRDKILRFTVYSHNFSIIQELVQQKLLEYKPWTDYENLVSELPKYDVGICLIHPLKKFHRNLPLKNFDYMGVGLPVITSNFGALRKYAELSGAAICINPLSAEDFEAAVLQLFDFRKRKELGENGIKYTRTGACFEKESEEYARILTSDSVDQAL